MCISSPQMDGWKASQPRDIIQDKDLKETPDLTIKKKKYKMDLLPPSLIVAHYFTAEQSEIDAYAKARWRLLSKNLRNTLKNTPATRGLLVRCLSTTVERSQRPL